MYSESIKMKYVYWAYIITFIILSALAINNFREFIKSQKSERKNKKKD